MKAIDEIHPKQPFRGSRQLRNELIDHEVALHQPQESPALDAANGLGCALSEEENQPARQGP